MALSFSQTAVNQYFLNCKNSNLQYPKTITLIRGPLGLSFKYSAITWRFSRKVALQPALDKLCYP